jgi:hypothetical protein
LNENTIRTLAIIALVLGAAGCSIGILEIISGQHEKNSPDIIQPIWVIGSKEFIEDNNIGPGYVVAFNDTDAFLAASFIVKSASLYKLQIYYTSSGANLGKIASGILNYSVYTDGENFDSGETVSNEVCDLPLNNSNIMTVYEHYLMFGANDNDLIMVSWQKNDTAGGAVGTMWIYAIVLIQVIMMPI